MLHTRITYRLLAIAASILLFASSTSLAREPEIITKNSEGKEFWLCFMKNFRPGGQGEATTRQDRLKVQLFITSSFDAKVKIQIEEIGYENTVNIRANTVVNVVIPPSAILHNIEVAERLGVHITADTSISVYGLNSRFQTTDTFVGLPVTVLGTYYRAVGYTKLAPDLLSTFAIIATEDGTEINISPSVTTSTGRPAKKPFSVSLRKGDVYSVTARWESIGACDLTGSLIKSNKPIAVFSGHNCAYVPPKIDACNHLVEQLPPVTAWGMHYYLGMLKERSRYTFRVLASEENTRVFEDSRLVAVLKEGEFYENLNVNRHLQVTADKPVLVSQFAQGFKNGDSVGDPMMILVSPTQQFLKDYRFATPINGDWHHYINLVAPTESIGEIRLNGRKIDSNLFTILGESRYSIAQVQVPFGTHVIKSDSPFGLYSYGFGFGNDAYDAYGNMAGQSFIEVNNLVDSLPPLWEGKDIRDGYLITFRDDRVFDKGLASVKIVSAVSLEADIPKIEPGTPQAVVRIRPSVSGHNGRLVINATDVAGNSTELTLCYVFDNRSERYMYTLSAEKFAECVTEETWIVGLFPMVTHNFHTASFPTTGDVPSNGQFSDGQGIGYGIGALLGRRIFPDLIVNARLTFSTMGGKLISPDSTSIMVRDTLLDTNVVYQEATTLGVNAPYLRIGATAQWFPLRYFYVTGGLNLSLAISNSVETQRTILRPSGYVFENGTSSMDVEPSSLSTLTSVGFEVLAGVGLSYPISFQGSVFLETLFTKRLNSVVSDADWKTEALGLNIGVLWRL